MRQSQQSSDKPKKNPLEPKYDIPSNQPNTKFIRFLSNWLDTRFRIPGTNFRFGLDAVMSVIPGVGGIFGAGASMTVTALIFKKGVPFFTALRMFFNIIIDFIVSSIPLIGIFFDVGFKANVKNLRLLEAHLAKNPDGDYSYGIWGVFALLVILSLVLIYIILFIWLPALFGFAQGLYN